jgi:hypothetical protein
MIEQQDTRGAIGDQTQAHSRRALAQSLDVCIGICRRERSNDVGKSGRLGRETIGRTKRLTVVADASQ